MTNRTEMLHFRATPEEKQTIRENAGHAEVALSEWMRQRSLKGESRLHPTREEVSNEVLTCLGEDPVTRENKAKVRQACEEDKPVDVQVVAGSAVPTQPAVEEPEPLLPRTPGTIPVDHGIAPGSLGSVGETYEQFMERRVSELAGENPTLGQQDAATEAAEGEWAQR